MRVTSKELDLKHILLIDDDASMRSLLTDYLSQHAFRVTGIGDSGHLPRILGSDPVDLVIVDLNLGHEDGLEIIRRLSTNSDAPAIIISGDRIEEADKVVGLELGAVDYITKPFGTREFLARVRASLRPRQAISSKRERRIYSFGDWVLNMKLRKLVLSGTTEVKLTAGEFNLLTAFLRSPRQVLSREQLLAASRVHDEEVFDRSIDVLILRLRRKLEADPSRPHLIKTERGAGYVFDADVTLTDRA
ncbi:winged helix-turn-helix domain-containing protein [Rhizobium sp. TRM95001]|nr:winged helix-turn-helix domain-containing protein [Rhizobium halophilum]